MKKTAEEIIARVNDLELDDEIKIELMEDITDSVNDSDPEAEARHTELEAKYTELLAKYNDLQERYKARFMEGKDPEEKDPDEEDVEVIDIKEI